MNPNLRRKPKSNKKKWVLSPKRGTSWKKNGKRRCTPDLIFKLGPFKMERKTQGWSFGRQYCCSRQRKCSRTMKQKMMPLRKRTKNKSGRQLWNEKEE